MDLEFSGRKTVIHEMQMKVGGSSFLVSGDLSGWDGLKGYLKVDSNHLDFSDFKVPKREGAVVETKAGLDRFWKRSDIKMTLNAPMGGQWKGLRFNDLKAECRFKSGDFYVRQCNVKTEHGIASVEGQIKRGGERPEGLFSAYVRMNRMPMKELLESLGVEKSYIEGLLSVHGIFYVKGGGKKDLINSLTGKANVSVEKGMLRESRVILQVLDFLSLQNIFLKKPPDLSNDGFYFEKIKGHVLCHEGLLETDSIKMESPVFNAAVEGWADLGKEWVEFNLGAQPLETIDWVVGNIPIIGYILTGDEKKLLIYYFKIKGPWSDPEVTYIPLKNMGGGVVRFLKRLFLTPGRLFKKIPKDIGDSEGSRPDQHGGDL
jgi:hypothetical protein